MRLYRAQLADVEWCPVPGYEGLYEVSSDGQVWTSRRPGSAGGLRKPNLNADGYWALHLNLKGGKRKYFFVHGLVALAFLGPCPEGLQVRHLDGNNTNNNVTNLQYGTPKENRADTTAHGNDPWGSRTECSHGHLYTPENTRIHPKQGNRVCKQCANRDHRDYMARRRARERAAL